MDLFLEDESRNARDRADHIQIKRTSSEAKSQIPIEANH